MGKIHQKTQFPLSNIARTASQLIPYIHKHQPKINKKKHTYTYRPIVRNMRLRKEVIKNIPEIYKRLRNVLEGQLQWQSEKQSE